MGALDGRIAIITGAGGGLGREHALLFAQEGAKVVVNDLGGNVDGSGEDRSAAQKVVDEIRAMGGEAVENHDNVADWEGAQRLVQTAIDAFGGLHVLVNNAGILRDKTILKLDEARWDEVLAVHLRGTFLVSQAFARHAVQRGGGGRIVNTTSVSGMLGNFGQANYAAAKAGVYGLTRTFAIELQ
ncbi:MAG: SDR family NAD(P)-dependent oxidoreductase, partial [Gemmatimonadota bacterium]